MNVRILPGRALQGAASVPGDKSISHRAALLGALAEGESVIENLLLAGVTEVMLGALGALGVAWELQGNTLRIAGRGPQGLRAARPNDGGLTLDCGHSATTLRLLAGALAGVGVGARLDGSDGLRRRPMTRLIAPLQQLGVGIEGDAGGRAPLTLAPRSPAELLRGGAIELPVASAQVKTALLLAGLGARERLIIGEPGPSRDHTERMLAGLGVTLECDPGANVVVLTPAGSADWALPPLRLLVPGDISAAAFLIVAALITPGSEIRLEEVGLNPTRTGLLEALQAMGASLEITPSPAPASEPVGQIIARSSELRAIEVGGDLVVRMIDEFPAFAIAAAFAAGKTVVRQAGELRHKESDRISVLCAALRQLGARVREFPDGFEIDGRQGLAGGARVDAQGDHRLAMSLVVAGLACAHPVALRGAAIIAQSYPNFLDQLSALGASVEVG